MSIYEMVLYDNKLKLKSTKIKSKGVQQQNGTDYDIPRGLKP